MYLTSLSLTGFRNFSTAQLQPSKFVNIFYGNNGVGKTNLLEAVFVLCLGRSQRGSPDAVLIQDGQEVYRIEGNVISEDKQVEVSVAYQRGGRKKIAIDGVQVKAAELYEQFAVVSAGPEDSEILQGAPSIRRTFIDIYLSQLSKQYLSTLTDYQRTLAQKNAALKIEEDPMPFDALLVPLGSTVTKTRAVFIEQLHTLAKEYYYKLSGGGNLGIMYQPSVVPGKKMVAPSEVEEAFSQKLSDYRQREMLVKTSLVGPHRDDIFITIGDLPARTHASQGEIRTAAISLKLSVFHLLKEKRETTPILLLDEVFAELDKERTNALVASFGDFGQIFLTTALEPPEKLEQDCARFFITQGSIERAG